MTVQASTLPVQLGSNQPIRRRVAGRAAPVSLAPEAPETEGSEDTVADEVASADAAETEVEVEAEAADASEPSEEAPPVAVKRGRGRPRKEPAVSRGLNNPAMRSDVVAREKPAAKRGRPAKAKVEAGKRGGPSKDDLALLGALFFEAKKNNVSVDALVTRFRGTVEAYDRANAASLE